MLLNILKSKIHRVQVTEANLEYIGSITIDEALMEAAGIYAGVVLVPGHAFASLWLDTPDAWVGVSSQGDEARLRCIRW